MQQSELFQEEIGFEGPEKNLQVIFKRGGRSLRENTTKERWQEMLDKTHCKILSYIEGEKCTAYLLSESSMFVYDDRLILKTCGTTKLLCGIDDIIQIGRETDNSVAAVLFWRKNFSFPEKQSPPHRTFGEETEYLEARFGNGIAIVSGPACVDHWCFYFSEMCKDYEPVIPMYEMKMHEIHPKSASHFFKEKVGDNAKCDTLNRGIHDLDKSMKVDEFYFEPCGYSMNGISGSGYETIHITPEEFCSYVSFETTSKVSTPKEFTSRVCELFRPASFTSVMISHTPNIDLNITGKEFRCVEKPAVYKIVESLYVTIWSFELESLHSHPLSRYTAIRQAKMVSLPDQFTLLGDSIRIAEQLRV